MERERLVSVIERVSDGRMSADGVADLILSELAAEKPTASGELVRELKDWWDDYRYGPTDTETMCKRFDEILSRYETRKVEGKRGKLIFVEEDTK